ncbi:hypothetical protein IFM89_005134 [Coptis chinensis]|uniref:Uncharacterized protein n=1 Tax=Coptis chinensis TaxID=261450 RepID=A0A835M4R1_9MAGN|nr:hypothetical protein IFM89_005134 [Coptis chinensis]
MRNLISSFSSHSSFSTPSHEENSSSLMDRKKRCEGLDLLVKAAIHVTGEFFLCIPFVQRRVIRRRKRALRFDNFSRNETSKNVEEEGKKMKKKKEGGEMKLILSPMKRKRVKGLPSKYNDSVLQSWKRRTNRRKPKSSRINALSDE